MISIAGRVLMTSRSQRSEIALARLGCAKLRERSHPRVLIGGLGLGFTLRAALDTLPKRARVVVAELNPVVVRWCRGPLAILTDDCLSDPRVSVVEGDVTRVSRAVADQPAQPRFDAILWDLYRGPGHVPEGRTDALYGEHSIARTHRALSPGGVYAVWGETRDAAFEARLARCGFRVERAHTSESGPRHAVYLAVK